LWLNEREIGRTPVDVDFLFYGRYDVALQKDGFEPLLTSGNAVAPWWDNIPFDLFAEMWPGQSRVKISWHYQLEAQQDDSAGLLERARDLRQAVGSD
jgi:hypothetical protein